MNAMFCNVNSIFSFEKRIQVTLSRVGSTGSIVDPSAEEEKCSPVSMVMGITGDPKNYGILDSKESIPKITCTLTLGNGSISESFIPSLLKDGLYVLILFDFFQASPIVQFIFLISVTSENLWIEL